MKKKVTMMAAVAAALLTVSCTLQDPDFTNKEAPRLSSIKVFGSPMYTMTYNKEGKATQYTDYLVGQQITVSYNPLEMEMVTLDSWYDGEADKEVSYVSERIKMTDIVCNGQGYVVSFTGTATEYDQDGSVSSRDVTRDVFEYDADGHLLQVRSDEGESMRLVWKDGCLVQMTEIGSAGKNEDTVVHFECEGPENKWGQWVPWWPVLGGLQMTGMFGKAPSRLISRAWTFDSPDDGSDSFNDEAMTFYYRMNGFGQIASFQMFEDSGEEDLSLAFIFNYGTSANL